MIKKFGSDVTVNVIASVFASLPASFGGRYQERQHYGKNLDEYDFYPFDVIPARREGWPVRTTGWKPVGRVRQDA